MEQQIETIIDKGLESIAPFFNISSIVIGAALVFGGIIFIIKKKGKNVNISLICIIIGIIAIISGFLQGKFR